MHVPTGFVVSGGNKSLFKGIYEHSVDDKGRLVMPKAFRYSLGEQFVMTRGLGGCIFVYHQDMYRTLTESFSGKHFLDQDAIVLQRFFTSMEAGVDGQGRVAIPAALRDAAGIKEQGEAVVLGAGRWVEIWDKDAWKQYNSALSDDAVYSAAANIRLSSGVDPNARIPAISHAGLAE